jgi:hypothetical protein
MPITFPVPLSDFADTIDVAAGQFNLSESRRLSISNRGEVFTRSGGARRWEGNITLTPAQNARSGSFDVMLDILTGAGASLLVYDHRRPYPARDPTGSILGSSVVVIASALSNFVELSLSGLPPGYVLSRGDYMSFTFVDVTGQTQWSLHRVVGLTVTASGAGVTPVFEVSPQLPDDVTLVGKVVTLKKATCKVAVRPQSARYSRGSAGTVSEGQSFDFVQMKR